VSNAQPLFATEVVENAIVGIRAEADISNERLGKPIRVRRKDKIPVMAVVGAKECGIQQPQYSHLASENWGTMPVTEVLEKMERAIATPTILMTQLLTLPSSPQLQTWDRV